MKAVDSNARHAAALRALARLLDYPGESLLANIDAVAEAVADAPAPPARRASVRPLLDRLATTEALQAQEMYVDTFDRGRRTSLNLFEHVHGDSRDRGQAMVDLLAMYRAAGIEPASEQLPDYLPAFLEFLSVLERSAAREHLGEVTHLVRAIGGVLAARGSDYAGAFDLLLALAGEKPLGADADGEDDTSYAAIDAAWLDAPVDFLGAAGPCGSKGNVTERPIQFQRRRA
jgi:nitrate reductase delta subunit